MNGFFSKCFVINLPFKTDRLASFRRSLPDCFGECIVWPAVHGDSIRHPNWWQAGSGAWGCYRSHAQILEHCYQQNVESYVVFEDDAIFRPDAGELFEQFVSDLPDDWEQIYLGGQLLHESPHPPIKVSDHVFIPFNVNRTHCFAVHRRGYEKLYKHLHQTPFQESEHIDHHLGRLHESGELKIYCPGRWIVGQDSGPSNISGNHNSATFWIDPERLSSGARKSHQHRKIPAIFLESSIDVAVELERGGWHRGHWQNERRLDRGVMNAIASHDPKTGLKKWYNDVYPEAVREGHSCVCLFHPAITWELAQTLDIPDLRRIKAETAKDGQAQLKQILEEGKPTEAPALQRNLLYFIWPKSGNGIWQWNVDQLAARIEQFDGVRSVAIATSTDADSVEDVKAKFAACRARIDNWIIVPNNPNLGEVAAFEKLLETVEKSPGVTFYGHAKGVRHDGGITRDWTEIMYLVNLDNPDLVKASLERFPITGTFKKNRREYGDQIKHGWHYAGTFFWFRNADVFARDWRSIQHDYFGSEKWPGDQFSNTESGCLFGDSVGWLYDNKEIQRIRKMYEDWRKRGVATAEDDIEAEQLRCGDVAPTPSDGSSPDEPVADNPPIEEFNAKSPGREDAKNEELGAVPAVADSPTESPKIIPKGFPTANLAVIVTCHNYGRYLEECLDSILAQTVQPKTIIVVDDASTDNTSQVCALYADVKYLRVEFQHISRTRKAGLDATTEPYILFVDADNWLDRDFIAKGMESFTNRTIAGAYADFEKFGNGGGRTTFPQFSRSELFRYNFIDTCAILRRDALELVDWIWDESNLVPDDYRRAQSLAMEGWTFRKQNALFHYRCHADQWSEAQRRKRDRGGYLECTELNRWPITLFIPLSGRHWAWTQQSAFLERQTYRHHGLNLILCDSSQNESFSREIRKWISTCDYPDVRHLKMSAGKPGIADGHRFDTSTERDVNLAMCKIYNRMRQEVNTEFLWILEDDIIPPDDVLDTLLSHLGPNIGSVSAAYNSRYDGMPVAWKNDANYNGGAPRCEPKSEGVEKVRGAGFGCLLLRTQLLKEHIFSLPRGVKYYDPEFFRHMGDQWMRLCDWSAKCKHLDPSTPKGWV